MALTLFLELSPGEPHAIRADFSSRAAEIGLPLTAIHWTASGEVDVTSVAPALAQNASAAMVTGTGDATVTATAVFESGQQDTARYDISFSAPRAALRAWAGRLRRQYPEFSNGADWPDETVLLAVERAELETAGSSWTEPARSSAIYAFAAHLLQITYPGGSVAAGVSASPGQAIASKSSGDESVSYFQNAMTSTDLEGLSATRYGQTFLTLRRRAMAGARVV